jgi:hypothetical protein
MDSHCYFRTLCALLAANASKPPWELFKLFSPPHINLLVMHAPSPSVVALLNPRHVRFNNKKKKKKKNSVSKNQGWEPIHQKCKTNEDTSRHNPKKTWT